mgnify:CR=1 FL=1
MTREEIESVYSRDVLDRNWWGNFPEPLDLLGKDFPKTADIYRLMPVCARIALHMGGELPRIIFSKEGGARMDFNSVVMNPEILSLKVSEQVRAEVFFGQYIHQVGHICYSRGVYEKYRCTLQQKYFIHLIEDRRIEGRIARVYPGYYYYLNAARRMQFTLALLRAEQELKFTDLDDVRYNYLATRVLFPELLEYEVFKNPFASSPEPVGMDRRPIGYDYGLCFPGTTTSGGAGTTNQCPFYKLRTRSYRRCSIIIPG